MPVLRDSRKVFPFRHKLPQFNPIALCVSKLTHPDGDEVCRFPGFHVFTARRDNSLDACVEVLNLQIEPGMRRDSLGASLGPGIGTVLGELSTKPPMYRRQQPQITRLKTELGPRLELGIGHLYSGGARL